MTKPPRPLLLLDVDGVVNVPGAAGAEEHLIELPQLRVVVSFAPGLRARLGAIAAAYDVMWLTSWGDWAPEQLGPLLGFDWPSAWQPQPGETQSDKVGAARRCAGDIRPFAWVDDLSFPGAVPWLRSRSGTYFIRRVDPRRGLDEECTTQLLDWEETLPREAPTR